MVNLYPFVETVASGAEADDVVEQIDKIVKATRFEGWQNSNSGPREIQKALMLTLAQFGLSKDKSLFEKAYAYIEGHY